MAEPVMPANPYPDNPDLPPPERALLRAQRAAWEVGVATALAFRNALDEYDGRNIERAIVDGAAVPFVNAAGHALLDRLKNPRPRRR